METDELGYAERTDSGGLRVAQMNVWGWRGAWDERRRVLVDGFRALRPDLVSFVESIKTDDYDLVTDILGPEYHVAQKTDHCDQDAHLWMGRLHRLPFRAPPIGGAPWGMNSAGRCYTASPLRACPALLGRNGIGKSTASTLGQRTLWRPAIARRFSALGRPLTRP